MTTAEQLLQLLRDDEIAEHIIEVRTDYSGRGMNGDTCIGVTTRNPARVAMDIGAAWYNETGDFPPRDVYNLTTDQMGTTQILYWPALHTDR